MNKYKVIEYSKEKRLYKIVTVLHGRLIASNMTDSTANLICRILNEKAREKGSVNVG